MFPSNLLKSARTAILNCKDPLDFIVPSSIERRIPSLKKVLQELEEEEPILKVRTLGEDASGSN